MESSQEKKTMDSKNAKKDNLDVFFKACYEDDIEEAESLFKTLTKQEKKKIKFHRFIRKMMKSNSINILDWIFSEWDVPNIYTEYVRYACKVCSYDLYKTIISNEQFDIIDFNKLSFTCVRDLLSSGYKSKDIIKFLDELVNIKSNKMNLKYFESKDINIIFKHVCFHKEYDLFDWIISKPILKSKLDEDSLRYYVVTKKDRLKKESIDGINSKNQSISKKLSKVVIDISD